MSERTKKVQTVLETIDSFCFAPQITDTAKKYYLDQQTLRASRTETPPVGAKKSEGHKKNLAFACIYQAHLLLKLPFSLAALAQSMDIKKNKIGKILTKYILFGFEPTIVRYNAFDFLELYSNYAGLPDDKYEAIARIATRVYANDPTLYDASPQKVTAAIINYFHQLNGHIYDKELFLRWVEITPGSLDSYTKHIKKVDEAVVH